MSTYNTRLIGSQLVADRTMAFHFEKPVDFAFQAGQAIDLILPSGADSGEAARHAFSLVSAPDEDRLTIATRLRGSAYKRALQALAPNAAVQIDGPFGSLILHKDTERDVVMIAGGIGITPFVSILRRAARQREMRHFVLVYSNRRPEDAAFLDEIMVLANHYPNLLVIPTLTQMNALSPSWAGRTGRIDSNLLASIGANKPIYYLAGPPRFVEAMRSDLCSHGADAEDIRSEGFYGY